MKFISRNVPFLLLAVVLFFGVFEAKSQDATCNGMALDSVISRPITGLRVTLDGVEDFEGLTDEFGLFSISGITPGTYDVAYERPGFVTQVFTDVVLVAGTTTKAVVEMVPLVDDVTTLFDICVQVQDAYGGIPLANASVTIRRWDMEDPGLSGIPTVLNLTADNFGLVMSVGWEAGFFEFSVTKTKWEPLTHPALFAIPLDSGTIVSIHLKPITQTLVVNVTGKDPTKDLVGGLAPVGALKGVTVEIVGRDPQNGNIALPVLQRTTYEDGVATFEDLPAYNWSVEVKRMGYEAFGLTLIPDEDGNIDSPLDVVLTLNDTKLELELESVYTDVELLDGAKVRFTGFDDTNSAEMDREVEAVIINGKAMVTFDQMLPGRYMVDIQHENVQAGPFVFTDALRFTSDTTFNIDFFAINCVAEAINDKTVTMDGDLKTEGVNEPFELKPVPAVNYGRVLKHDELVDPMALLADSTRSSDSDRKILPMEVDGIQYEIHDVVKPLFPEEMWVVSTGSDKDGAYQISLIPGIYGIKLPELDGYSGHNIETTILNFNFGPYSGPWPYADAWEHPNIEGGHHRGPISWSSKDECVIDLYLHRWFVDMAGVVEPDPDDPFRTMILSSPDDDSPIEVPYTDLIEGDDKGMAKLTGTKTDSVALHKPTDLANIFYLFKDLGPGNYSVTVDHDRNTFDPLAFAIAPFPRPGIPPTVDPRHASYFFAGILHKLEDENFELIKLQAEYKHAGEIEIHMKRTGANGATCGGGELPTLNQVSCLSIGVISAQYFRAADIADGNVFKYVGGGDDSKIPSGQYAAWRDFGADGWFTGLATGSQEGEGSALQAQRPHNIGGQVCLGSTFCEVNVIDDADHKPPWAGSYTLTTKVRARHNPKIIVEGVSITFFDDSPAEGNATAPHSGSFVGKTATHIDGKWLSPGFTAKVTNFDIHAVEVLVLMDRAMTINGTVKIKDTEILVPGAQVIVKRRSGSGILKRSTTPNEGTFSFTEMETQSVFIEVWARGFFPFRKHFPSPDPNAPDIADIVLELSPLPQPEIGTIELDRFGLFLPGISKTGNSDASALGRTESQLELTWSATVLTDTNLQVTLPGFEDAAGNSTPDPKDFSDIIRTVWLIDPRFFTEPAFNTDSGDVLIDDPENTTNKIVFPDIEDFNYVVARKMLDEIQAQKQGNDKYIVKFDRMSVTETPDDDKYGGIINLFDLPSGFFVPYIVVVTKRGAVSYKKYVQPVGKFRLQGLRTPPWFSFIADIIGSNLDGVAATETSEKILQGLFSEGTMIPLPTFSIDISETAGYVKYKYSFGVRTLEGSKTPENPPLAGGNKSLGISLKGSVGVVIDGKGEITFKVQASLSKSLAKELGLTKISQPATALIFVKIKTLSATGTGKLSLTHNLNDPSLTPHDDPNFTALTSQKKAIPEFKLTATTTGFMEAVVALDITPLIKAGTNLIPPPVAGVIVKGILNLTRAQVNLIAGHGFGGQKKTIWSTYYPPLRDVGGTSPIPQETQRHFLGGTEVEHVLSTLNPKKEYSLLWKYLWGLNIQIFGGRGEGTASLQIGAPRGSSDPGVKLTLATQPINFPFARIQGAISGILAWKVDLFLVSYGKDYTFDLYTFDFQFGTDPFVEVLDLDTTYTRITPATVPAATFHSGIQTTVIEDLFNGSQLDLAAGGTPILAFTDADPAEGSDGMRLQVSMIDGGNGWTVPVSIVAGPGVLDVTVIPNPAGGFLVVWTEIDADDIGNPFPSSRIRFSTSADGITWTAPATIPGLDKLDLAEAAFAPQMVASADKILLAFVTTEFGPFGASLHVQFAVFDTGSSTWSLLQNTPDRLSIAGFSMAGLAGGATPDIVITITDGEGMLEALHWTGLAMLDDPVILAPIEGEEDTTSAAQEVSVAYDADGLPVLVWERKDGGLSLFRRNSEGMWLALGEDIVGSGVGNIAITAIGDPGDVSYLIVWSQGGDPTQLFHAYIDGDGTVIQEPTSTSNLTGGIHRQIFVRLTDGNNAMVGILVKGTDAMGDPFVRFDEVPITFGIVAPEPPTITVSPMDKDVTTGTDLTLVSVATDDTGNVSYQWFKDFKEIDGATGDTLTIENVELGVNPEDGDHGVYQVRVTNSSGDTFSDVASVGVTDDFTILLHPRWNLISFPVDTPITVGDIFQDEIGDPIISGSVWVWNPVRQRFTALGPDSVMTAFRGGWVYSPEGGQTRFFTGVATGEPAPVGPGWHLIGLPATGPLPAGFTPVGLAWDWLSGQKLEQVDPTTPKALKLLKAYWVLNK